MQDGELAPRPAEATAAPIKEATTCLATDSAAGRSTDAIGDEAVLNPSAAQESPRRAARIC
jgi:hypothetical protein